MKLYFTPIDSRRQQKSQYLIVDWTVLHRRHSWKILQVYKTLRRAGWTDLKARWAIFDILNNVHQLVLSDGTVMPARTLDELEALR